jgi:hypothetical protein
VFSGIPLPKEQSPMTCQEILDLVAQREGAEPLSPEIEAHLEGCAGCRGQARLLLALDAFALAQLPAPPIAVPRLPRPLPWKALAASLLLALGAGLFLFNRSPSPAGVPASSPSPALADAAGSLELAPGAIAGLQAGRLSLRAGACWVESRETVELDTPIKARILPGSQVELALDSPDTAVSWHWIRMAEASDASILRISVVAGTVELPAFPGSPRLQAGSRGRIRGETLKTEPLTDSHQAGIEAWRVRALQALARPVQGSGATLLSEGRFLETRAFPEGAVLSARLRKVTGALVLRYPLPGGAGETTLGGLPVWRDQAWHALVLKSGGGGVEIFLDGRMLLKVPPLQKPEARSSGMALGVRGGSAEVADLSVGPLP